jgi:hypothetical protein
MTSQGQSSRSYRRLIRMAVVGIILLIGVLTYMSLSTQVYECTACVTFNGRTECRTARAATQEESTRAAIATACAVLAYGMTESLQCERTRPTKIECIQP